MFSNKNNKNEALSQSVWIPLEQSNQLKINQQFSTQLLNAGYILTKSETQQLNEEYGQLYSDSYCLIGQCIVRKNNQLIRLSQGKNSTDIYFKKYDDLEMWFNIIRRYAIQVNFSKEYKLTRRLGYLTQFSQIYQVKCFSNNQNYNVKIFNKNTNKVDHNQMMSEIKILRKLKHKNISNLIEVFDDQQSLYVVFEQYYGTEMIYKFEDLLNCCESTIARIIFKILDALHCIHQNGIIHGDLKMENIFIKSDKLADICITNFSTAEFIDQQEKNIKGSEGYQAPELLNQQLYDQSIDIYSVGIILYYLIYQVMPYSESFENHDNKTGVITFPQIRCSQYCINFLKQLLKVDPKERINAHDALQHEWFIQMRVEEKLNKKKKMKSQNLPTILEKSDLFTMSPGQQPKNECIGIFEDEFLLDSLSERMTNLENKFNPSKQNHDQFMAHNNSKFQHN